MSGLKLGDTAAAKLYVGDTPATKLYLGDSLAWSSAVPLTIVGAASAAATSVTLPTLQVGDIVVLWPFARNSGTAPTKPTASGTVPSWVDIDNLGGGSALCSGRTAYSVATATNITTGAWTGASGILAVVLRGQNATTPIGGHGMQGGSGLNATAPSITMTNTSGSSTLLHFFGARSGSATVTWGAAPTGYTQREADGSTWVALDTKNDTTSDGSVTNTRTGATANYHAATVEILAQ